MALRRAGPRINGRAFLIPVVKAPVTKEPVVSGFALWICGKPAAVQPPALGIGANTALFSAVLAPFGRTGPWAGCTRKIEHCVRKHQVDDIGARQPEVGHQGSGPSVNVEIAFPSGAHEPPKTLPRGGSAQSPPPPAKTLATAASSALGLGKDQEQEQLVLFPNARISRQYRPGAIAEDRVEVYGWKFSHGP